MVLESSQRRGSLLFAFGIPVESWVHQLHPFFRVNLNVFEVICQNTKSVSPSVFELAIIDTNNNGVIRVRALGPEVLSSSSMNPVLSPFSLIANLAEGAQRPLVNYLALSMPLSFKKAAYIPVSVYQELFTLAMALAVDPVSLIVDAVYVC